MRYRYLLAAALLLPGGRRAQSSGLPRSDYQRPPPILLKKSLLLLAICFINTLPTLGQQNKQQVFFSDIDHFWTAYDSIHTTTDSLKQLQYFTKLYLAKGTAGLKALQDVKGYTAPEWVSAIRRYPKFWQSIRPNTQLAKTGAQEIPPYLKKLAVLYPALRPASLYFTIGALRSSGTTKDSLVLIGTELAAGTAETDITGFSPAMQAFLTRYYKSQPLKNLVVLSVHEYVHTQQKGPPETTLLAQALYEGTCDLVAELVTGKLPLLPYVAYGPAHEAQLKEQFKADMFSPYTGNWFYNQVSDDPQHVPDLGYYMGYAICKAYYQRAQNKKLALKELIELAYADEKAVEALLRQSAYYPTLPGKEHLLNAYERSRPVVTRVPAISPDGYVDVAAKEIQVEFSAPMSPNTGTDYGSGGKEQWPLTGRGKFAADKRSFTYPVALQPGRAYSFMLNGGGFRSADGRPLRPCEVKFKTKAQ